MTVKHSLSIILSRFSVFFKTLIYTFVVLCVFFVICTSILSPIFADVRASVADTNFFGDISTAFRQFVKGEAEYAVSLESANLAFGNILDILAANNQKLVVSVIIIAVVALLCKYVLTLAYVSYSDIIHNFMQSNSYYPFLSNFIANLKRSALYALLHLFTVSLTNAIIVFLTVLLFIGLLKIITPLIAFIMCFMIIFLLFAAKNILFAGWLPALVCENGKVTTSLKTGFKAIKKISTSYLTEVLEWTNKALSTDSVKLTLKQVKESLIWSFMFFCHL
jgi:hypothetical protein